MSGYYGVPKNGDAPEWVYFVVFMLVIGFVLMGVTGFIAVYFWATVASIQQTVSVIQITTNELQADFDNMVADRKERIQAAELIRKHIEQQLIDMERRDDKQDRELEYLASAISSFGATSLPAPIRKNDYRMDRGH